MIIVDGILEKKEMLHILLQYLTMTKRDLDGF